MILCMTIKRDFFTSMRMANKKGGVMVVYLPNYKVDLS